MEDAPQYPDEFLDRMLSDIPSFVQQPEGTGQPDFWKVEECGDPQTDNMRGFQMADQAIAFCHKYESPMLIARALYSIASHGRTGPVECGFLARIACAAAAGALN